MGSGASSKSKSPPAKPPSQPKGRGSSDPNSSSHKNTFDPPKSSVYDVDGEFESETTADLAITYIDKDKGRLVMPSKLPPPRPPARPKSEIFDPSDFKRADDRAIKCPKSALMDFDALYRHLKSGASSDLEIVRSIYRWITIQDCKKMSDTIVDETHSSPKGYLASIENETASYADLFLKLCLNCEIPCKIVRGNAKGMNYLPGQEISGNNFNMVWNAALIGSYWRLFDAHWGARHISGDDKTSEWSMIDTDANPPGDEESTVEYATDEHYFMADPVNLIYSHFPDEPKWQLLDKPISMKEFEQLAFVKSPFFKMGLSLASHHKAIVQADKSGKSIIQFALPIEDNVFLSFAYRLFKSEGSGTVTDSVNEVSLGRYCLQQFSNKMINFELRFPSQGVYLIEMFCKEEDPKGKPSNQATVMHQISSYIIACDSFKGTNKPLPVVTSKKGYGPGIDCMRTRVEALTHKTGIITTETGQVEFKFKTKHNMEFVTKLHKNTSKDDVLTGYVMHSMDNKQATFNLNLPEPGEYALEIFGKQENDRGMLPHICDYLIRFEPPKSAKVVSPVLPYPSVPNGRYGPSKNFKRHGVYPVNYTSSVIYAPPSGELSIEFDSKNTMDYIAELNSHTGDSFAGYIMPEFSDSSAKFLVRLPKTGIYHMGIFAKGNTDSGSLANIYNYLIYCTREGEGSAIFPTTYAKWGKGCKLIDPIDGELPANSLVDFDVVVPDAQIVAVVSGETWTQMEKTKDGSWEAEAMTGKENDTVQIVACSNPGGDFDVLLSYHVVKASKSQQAAAEKRNEQAEKQHKEEEARLKIVEAEELRKQEIADREKERLAKIAEENDRKAKEDAEAAEIALAAAEAELKQSMEKADRLKAEENLRKAKEAVLEKKHASVRQSLTLAIKYGRRHLIIAAMEDFKKNKIPDTEGDYGKAQNMLICLDLKAALRKAIAERDLNQLENTIHSVEKSNMKDDLKLDLAKANRVAEGLRRIEKMRHDIMKLNQWTIAEIRSYSNPPDVVKKVFVATLLLLGNSEKETRDWDNILIFIGKLGKESLKRKCGNFDTGKLQLKTALRAEEIMSQFKLNDVRDVSAGAATFYKWSVSQITEAKSIKEDKDEVDDDEVGNDDYEDDD